MSTYDDDRVVALLRDAVPAVPEASPDRVSAIRARAGRQRTMAWTQTLGATVSVVLVVGVAAAVSTPGARTVEPTDRPIAALADALLTQRSVRFEATMQPTGNPRMRDVPDALVRQMLTARLAGEATRDGDVRIDGDLSFFDLLSLTSASTGRKEAAHLRVVDGKAYHSLTAEDDPPPGKKWVVETESEPAGVEQLVALVRMASGFAEDVRYTGEGTVRGTRVAEYELTVPESVTRLEDITVEFALDADNLLRRVETEFSWGRILEPMLFGFNDPMNSADDTPEFVPPQDRLMDPLEVRVRLDFFDYGADVTVVAPPASEVATWDEVWNAPDEYERLRQCLDDAESHDEQRACYEDSGFDGTSAGTGDCTTTEDGETECAASAPPEAPRPFVPPATASPPSSP